MKTLMKKIVFVMDNTINIDYDKNEDTDIKLSTYINMNSSDNSFAKTFKYIYDDLIAMKITPPIINSDGFTTKVWNNTENNVLQQVLPIEKNSMAISANFATYGLIRKYGIQIIPMAFWANDNNLFEYEAIFTDSLSAFAPISNVLRFIDRKKRNMAIDYPSPPFA